MSRLGEGLDIMHPSSSQKDTTHTKIFVGGLPYHTDDSSLRRYFSLFGGLDEAVVITDRHTGKSRGYGFVTMADRGAAERACKDPNPIIDGRKANVNLAYLGAKPRPQTGVLGFSVGVQQLHPALIQRQYGLAQQYVFPQTFLPPSLMLQSQLGTAVGAGSSYPYLDYAAAYARYAAAAGLEPYPYTPSPSPTAGYLGYSFSPAATPGPAAPPTPPMPAHPSLAPLSGVSAPQAAFLHHPLHQH